MAASQTRENRAFAYEIKFLAPARQAREVRALARSCMQADPNTAGGSGDLYRITSLYYDTYGFEVFHQRGSFGRCKYRVRRYDACDKYKMALAALGCAPLCVPVPFAMPRTQAAYA